MLSTISHLGEDVEPEHYVNEQAQQEQMLKDMSA